MTNQTPQSKVEHFGKFLATLREARGLTQERLAQMTGISVGTIYRGERAAGCSLRRSVTMNILKALNIRKRLTPRERQEYINATGISKLVSQGSEAEPSVDHAEMY